jgi:cytochrome b subunit of formate dehydrogenase
MLDDTRRETVSQASNGEPGTKEAEALASALNHSAERVQTLWFSFLTFMLYLAIATGTTTHRMLFLEEPLNLPVLNIKLPLLGFYILTPIVFVVFHFYMLFLYAFELRASRPHERVLRMRWYAQCPRMARRVKIFACASKTRFSCSSLSAAGGSAKESTPGS